MKLEGIRVLDLSLFLPGPHFSMMMADHGAEVIALEPPGGEPVRQVGLKQDENTVWFRNVFRGKKSINLNLKSDQGKQAFYKLCEEVDVIIEAFRPGVVDRLGIGYEQIKAIKSRYRLLLYLCLRPDWPKTFKSGPRLEYSGRFRRCVY